MNSYRYLSACLLALLAPAAFAQGAPLASATSFAVLSAAPDRAGAVTCTDSIITGDVGSSGLRPSVVETQCTISGAVKAPVLTNFDALYNALALKPCDQVLTTLDGQVLSPGVYCVDAAATSTGGVLTLDGPANASWTFRIGTSGTGALTGTGFKVAMTGGAEACNVTWWVAQAATMTDSKFVGTILAGAGITVTGGTFNGNALARAAVTLTDTAVLGCALAGGTPQPVRQRCNQGVGNGPEACDPGNSNQGNPFRSNDESVNGIVGTPGNPGRKGGNK